MTTKTQKAVDFRERILRAMIEIGEPATVSEIGKYVGRQLGTELNDYTIRQAMRALTSEGRLHERTETDAEREIRFNGQTVFASSAKLYYPAVLADKVPARTVVSIAPGIVLSGRTKPWGRPVGTRNKKRSAARGATPKVTGTTGGIDKAAIDFLVEKLVDERTKDLQRELADTKAQLAAIRSLLK